jgi:hypothetical protein
MELILSILKLVSMILGIGKPLLDEHQIHKHDEEAKQLLEDWQNILQEHDEDKRRNAIAAFMSGLCNEIGHPPGVLSGRTIRVPVEYFHSSILGNIELTKLQKALAHSNSVLNNIAGSKF